MKAKLIKLNDYYNLQDEKGNVIGTSYQFNSPVGDNLHKLSKQNCEAIANGYDVYELAKENYHKFWPIIDESGLINHTFGYVEGFQKALEILGDKKFSKEDVKKAYMIGWNSCNNFNGNDESQEFIESPGCIQSLQQTEWDVEVDMEDLMTFASMPKEGENRVYEQPKLDADGCLILKRK